MRLINGSGMKQFLAILTLLLIPSFLGALPPVFVLGGGGGISWDKNPLEPSEVTPYAELSGTLGYRGFLGASGYFGLTGFASLLYYGGELREIGDEQFLSLEFGTPLAELSLRGDLSLSSAIDGAGGGGYALPEWEFTASRSLIEGELVPRIIYFGSYYYEEIDSGDRLVNGLRAGIQGEPEVTVGWYADLLSAWERFPEQRRAPDDRVRQDGRFGMAGGADGLLGYFHSWNADGEVGLRLSNAAAGAEDRFYSELAGSLRLSPTQSLGIELGAGVDHDYYLEQEARKEDGVSTGSALQQLSLSSSLRVDVTPNGALFFVLQAGVGRSFSEDPSFRGWSSHVSGEIEYSF